MVHVFVDAVVYVYILDIVDYTYTYVYTYNAKHVYFNDNV